MNITFVYPSIRNNGGFNTLGTNSESVFINHGVASLSAVLKQAGHAVNLLDLREMKDWKATANFIRANASDFYAIHMPTLDYHEAVRVAELIKLYHPSTKVLVGGPHPSICPHDVAKEKVFDSVFIGEGESTLPEAVSDYQKFSNTKIVYCERPDLDKLPYEDREIFNIKKIFATKSPYTGKPFFPAPFVNVISGRGCVYRCGFCKPGEDKIFGSFRMRSIDHFFGEIEMLNEKYNFKTLMIDDDSFTLNTEYVLKFCDKYEAIRKPFYCQSRADYICKHPDIMKRLKEVGLDMVFVGFESGSQRMLDLMKKDTTVGQNIMAARICKGLGIKIWANIMVGLPTETKDEMQRTFSMVKEIKPEHPSYAVFTPIVGTELFDYCKTNGLLLSEDPAVLGSRNPSVPKINGQDYDWIKKQMYPNSTILKRVAKKAIRTIKKFKM